MPGRILVVDDIATNRAVMRARLGTRYYETVEANSGAEAIEIAHREQPDLILLDVMMPGMDGFETCRRLKADPKCLHIPVVMVTALDGREDRLRGLDVGADDFLTKPCGDMPLFSRVSSLLRMKLMLDELRLRHETSRKLGLAEPPAADAGLNFADSSLLLVGDGATLVGPATQAIRERLGAAVEGAAGEAEARALLASNRFDACLIGPDLADGRPMALASHLRTRPETRQTSVMMIFAPGEVGMASAAMEIGVADYLGAPLDLAEMTARLKVQLRRKHYSDRLRSAVEDSLVMAVTDPLTGLYNRRYANNHLEQLIARHQLDGHGLAAMVLDLDRFKAVNDTHGHAAGDEVLREFARRLRESVRGFDLVSRVGGEEFLVVMPDVHPENASRVAERVRAAIEDAPFVTADARLKITVSIGLAFNRLGESGAELVRRADMALYESKGHGRNRVTLAAA
ncbi:MAG TPA: PleD family two-component system response regulator [Thermohalobaculum sp.]|nr:PleD family two-component system response regulator [Thermohalobaculum sp.]